MMTTGNPVRHLVGLTILCALSLGLVATFSSIVSAAPIPPSGTLFPAPAEPDPVGGLVIGTTGPVPFATASYVGTLDSSVILGDLSNPFGGLTFTYLLTNSAVSTGEIDRLTINNYAGFLVDASYQVPPIGLPPTLINRSGGLGDVMGFTFLSGLGPGVLTPGTSSALLVLQTNAVFFAPTLASVIDGQVTSVASLAPSLVPEPCGVVLAGLGIGAAALLRLRGRSGGS